MSVVMVLWIMLTIGFAGVTIAALIAWRQRMRESLPSPDAAPHYLLAAGEHHDHVADRRLRAAARRAPRAA